MKQNISFGSIVDIIKVCCWPDGTWCRAEKLSDYDWKSDDYTVFSLTSNLTDEDIDKVMSTAVC